MRKEVAARVGAALLVGSFILSGCQPANSENQAPLTPKLEQTAPTAWKNLPAIERADRLELKNFPKGLDVNVEIARAISELYSQQMPIKRSAQDMLSQTHFATGNAFIEEYKKLANKPSLSGAEKEELVHFPEITFNTQDPDLAKRQTIIDTVKITNLIPGIKARMTTDQFKKLDNHDLKIIAEESIIAHAYGHQNSSSEQLNFSTLVEIPKGNPTYLATGINGLDLEVIDLRTNSSLVLANTNEGMTDFAANLLKKKKDTFIFNHAAYPATILIANLNEKAGIDNDEFKDYYFGNKSIHGMLLKWGSIKNPKNPDFSLGVRLYFLVNLSADPNYNPDMVRDEIEREIDQKFDRVPQNDSR